MAKHGVPVRYTGNELLRGVALIAFCHRRTFLKDYAVVWDLLYNYYITY